VTLILVAEAILSVEPGMRNLKRRKTGLAAIIALGVFWACVESARFVQDHSKAVAIQSGRLEGTVEIGIATFKSIPCAAPPIGTLRWKAPQLPASWECIRPAKEYGPPCIQYDAKDGRPKVPARTA
jgi:hypothetical protein